MKCSINKVTIVGFIKATIFGLTYLVVGNILEKISLFDLLSYRFLAAALAFYILRIFKVIKIDLKGKNILPLIGIALLQPIGYYIFESMGIERTSSLMSGIIICMTPVVTMVVEAIVLKEKANNSQASFIILSTLGVVLITVLSESGGANSMLGIMFLMLAVLFESFFVVLTRKATNNFTPVEITYVMMVITAIAFNGINVVRRAVTGELSTYFMPLLDKEIFWGIMFLGVLASTVAYILYSFMLSETKASSTAVFAGVSTVVSIIAGVIWRHEAFLWYHAIGTVCIIFGVWGVSNYKEEEQELLENENDEI